MPDPNPFDQFDTAQAPAPPPNAFDQFDQPSGVERTPEGRLRITIGPKPLPAGGNPGGSSMGTGEALVTGLKQGLSANFSDELAGVNAAAGLPDIVGKTVGSAATLPVGLARLAYEHATGQPGEATKAFNETVAQVRQQQQQAQEEHPIASTAGNIGGALATSLLPLGAASQGASLGARMGAGALAGGAYGAAYGAGEGEGLEDRAQRAATGGALGATMGAVAPPILSGVGAAAKFIGNRAGALLGHPIQALQASKDIDQAASQRVADLLKYDAQNTPGGMSASDVAAAHVSGQSPVLMDLGNAATQEAARAAANTSPASRAALETPIKGRFEEQSQRVSDFVKGLVPTPANADRTREALEQAARLVNKPAYAKAYSAGDRQVWTPELERLTAAPYVQSALRGAISKWKNYAIRDGFGAMNPPFRVENGGLIKTGGNGLPAYPNIQLWDYAARELQDRARAAPRGSQIGALYNDLARLLKTELDKEVPEYGAARAGASAFFGAENALEAGQKFVNMRGSLEQARQAINKMSAPERSLFAEGFASDLADKVSKIANNRNVTIDRIFNSPDGKARINLALGPNRAGELEMFLRREDVMDLARKAVSGNSTTARQLIMQSLANAGSHGAVGAGIGASIDEILNGELNWKHVLLGGMLVGTGVATSAVNAKLAQSIAEKLASDDPKVWREVLRMAANNPQVANTVKRGEAFLEKLVGSTSGNHPMLPITGALPAAADQQQQQ